MTPTPDSNYREGQPMIYVPVCKHPRDFMFTFGPVAYCRVAAIVECPISVRRPAGGKRERAAT